MILVADNHPFLYETENMCRAFYPYEEIKTVKSLNESDNKETDDRIVCFTSVRKSGKTVRLFTRLTVSGQEYFCEKSFDTELDCGFLDDEDGEKQRERDYSANPKSTVRDKCELVLAQTMFDVLTRANGRVPKWGILTGVRPMKLFHTLINEHGSEEKACEYFTDVLSVSPEKKNLTCLTSQKQRPILALNRPDSFSLYISIPFCPTRCAYCSFVSQSIEKAAKLIPKYVEYLKKEIAITGDIAKRLGLRLETVYWGGGTPTSLSAQQLDDIMTAIEDNFDLSTVREYTVEAGRPDTITEQKLETLKRHNVGRISVNPQTLNDEVLCAIGRRHTAQQTIDAFNMAKKYGFDINMDLIAGLPLDNLDSFNSTLDTIIFMQPQNITVHTLSMKRSSYLTQSGAHPTDDQIYDMLQSAEQKLTASGFYPYYLYRQSRMLGNLENIGWTVADRECLYNVYIMDETHTILACGASGVTKLRQPDSNRIERIFNFKFPYEYNDRFDILMERKRRIIEFYDEFNYSVDE